MWKNHIHFCKGFLSLLLCSFFEEKNGGPNKIKIHDKVKKLRWVFMIFLVQRKVPISSTSSTLFGEKLPPVYHQSWIFCWGLRIFSSSTIIMKTDGVFHLRTPATGPHPADDITANRSRKAMGLFTIFHSFRNWYGPSGPYHPKHFPEGPKYPAEADFPQKAEKLIF